MLSKFDHPLNPRFAFLGAQIGFNIYYFLSLVPTKPLHGGPAAVQERGDDEGRAGDNVGLLLRGLKREQVERGQVICKPGSITPHTNFKAQVYVLTKDEGGRHTPFFTNYRPQFYFRTTDVTGVVQLPVDVEMVMPGDNVAIEVELITPIALEKEVRFAIREGGRTIGSGVVTEVTK